MNLFEYIDTIKNLYLKRFVWSATISVAMCVILAVIDWAFAPLHVLAALTLHVSIILTFLLMLLSDSAEVQNILSTRASAIQSMLARNVDALIENGAVLKSIKDPGCSWESASTFFLNLCRYIHNIEKPIELYVYRGYDHCTEEANRDLRDEIVAAMQKGAITVFHRVIVVTTERSIANAVDWMEPFAKAPELRARCKFGVAFRRNYNLGSFVVPGPDQCFIAMPTKVINDETGVISETACGVFAERREIADVVRFYITNLMNRTREKPTIHAMVCDLKEFVTTDGSFEAEPLVQKIRLGFRGFDDADKPASGASDAGNVANTA